MRFAFAGIDFLGDVFETLVASGLEPVKLFTRACDNVYDFNDVILGRARALRLPVQTSRIRPADLAALGAAGCDLLVVAGYPWLVKDWEPHLRFAVNVHPSPLPEGRGPYPLFKAILDDRRDWGVTVHVLTPTFDAGPIVAQDRFALDPCETHDTLLAKCQLSGKRLAARIATDLPHLWEEAKPQSGGSYWPRIRESERTLDFGQDVADVLRQVRAFASIEALATIGGKRVFVWQAAGWREAHEEAPGTVLHRHRRHIVVAARDGFVHITGWSAAAPQGGRQNQR